jgi:hypothetical protein
VSLVDADPNLLVAASLTLADMTHVGDRRISQSRKPELSAKGLVAGIVPRLAGDRGPARRREACHPPGPVAATTPTSIAPVRWP